MKPLIGLADDQFKILYSDVFDLYCEHCPTLLTHSKLRQRKIEFIRSVIQKSAFTLFSSQAETLSESRDAWTYAIYLCSLLCGTEAHRNTHEPIGFKIHPEDIPLLSKLISPPIASWLKAQDCYEPIHELFQKKEPSRFTQLFHPEEKPRPIKKPDQGISDIKTTQKELLEHFIKWLDHHLKKQSPRISKHIKITPKGTYLQSPIIFELFESETLMSSKFAQRAVKKSDQFLRSRNGNFIHQCKFGDQIKECLLFRK